MQTVDYKDFLTGVVKTGGIVNEIRAVEAAKMTLSMDIDSAVINARQFISDISEMEGFYRFSLQYHPEAVLPISPMFK